MSSNAGGWGWRVSANEYSCAHGAQINFRDLTLYIYDLCMKLNIIHHIFDFGIRAFLAGGWDAITEGLTCA
jgi:hypothetical protein